MSRCRIFCLGIAVLAALCVRAVAQQPVHTAPDGQAAEQLSLHNPYFVENNGRITDTEGRRRDDILYTASAGSARLFFCNNRISYVLVQADAQIPALREALASGEPLTAGRRMRPDIRSVAMHRVDLEFDGCNADITVESGARSAATTRFLTAQGESHAASFGELIYRNVYDNIDMVFRLEGGTLKYDFIVHPGGRVSDIRLRYNGAGRVEVDGEGTLRVATPLGVIAERIPAAFVQDARENRLDDVTMAFRPAGDNTVALAHDGYNTAHSLVIDPLVEFSTYVGGSDLEGLLSLGRQTSDYNFYVVGYTLSLDYPASPGAYQTASGGGLDAFIFKFDETGNRLWSTYYGGSGDDGIEDVQYDNNDNIVVVGSTKSANLPGVTIGSFQPAHAGTSQNDAFIAKFDNSGALLWATYYGGTGNDIAAAVSIDAQHYIYVCGMTNSTPFPVNLPVPPGLGGYDGFILKFGASGNRIVARRFGGSGDDVPTGITRKNVDLMVVGYSDTPGPAFSPSTAGALQTTNAGGYDVFAARFNNSILTPVIATFFGGNDWDMLPFISWDNRLESTVSFTTFSTNMPVTLSAMQPSNAGGADAFVAVLDNALNATSLLHATYFGGSSADEGRGIVVNSYFDMVFLTGMTGSSDLPATSPPLLPLHPNLCGSDVDAFLLQLSPQYALLSCSYIGGCGDDYGQRLFPGRCDKSMYLAGTTFSSDFLTTPDVFQPSYNSNGDGFLMNINIEPNLLLLPAVSGPLTIPIGGSVGLGVVPARIYSLFTSFGSLQWYRDGEPVPGATTTSLVVTKPGRYYLGGTLGQPGCDYYYSNIVEVRYNCADDPLVDYTTYQAGYTFPAGSTTVTTTPTYHGYVVDGAIVVPAGAVVTFSNTVLLGQNCAEIIVMAGGELHLDNCVLQGCSNWRGITVYGEAFVDACTFSDADVAVYSLNGGVLDIRGSVFFDNNTCVAVGSYPFPHTSVIRGNFFDHTDTSPYQCFRPPFSSLPARPMVYIDGVNDLVVETNTFYDNFFTPAVADVVGVDVYNSSWLTIFGNTFDGSLATALQCTATQSLWVDNNSVPNALAVHTKDGVIIRQSMGGDWLMRNNLYRCDNGIQYYTSAFGMQTTMRNNLFEENTYGLVISTDEHPVNAPPGANSSGNTISVEIECNKFRQNQYGIIGSGNLIAQGSGADESNNMFFGNLNWDILWQTAAPFNYYNGSIGFPAPPLNSACLQPAMILNGVVQFSPDLTEQLNVAVSSSCRGTWIMTSAEEAVPDGGETIRLYPNPFADDLTLDMEGRTAGAAYTLDLIDVLGRRVYSTVLPEGSVRLTPGVLAPGMYTVRIYKNTELIRTLPVMHIGR